MYILSFWLFHSWAFFTLIPAIIFIPTILYLIFKPIQPVETSEPPSLIRRYLCFSGNLDKICILNLFSGWGLLGVGFLLGNSGFLEFSVPLILFIHYFLVQVFHFINLVTTTEKTLSMKLFCLAFMIPEVYMFSIALVLMIPCAFYEFFM